MGHKVYSWPELPASAAGYFGVIDKRDGTFHRTRRSVVGFSQTYACGEVDG
jgi:hypothetical protein